MFKRMLLMVMVVVIAAGFGASSSPALASGSLAGRLASQISRDISRIENTARRYRADACVSGFIEVGNAVITVECNGVDHDNGVDRDNGVQLRPGGRLQNDLTLRLTRAADRLERIAYLWDAGNGLGSNGLVSNGLEICIELNVDLVDRRGRWTNFGVSRC